MKVIILKEIQESGERELKITIIEQLIVHLPTKCNEQNTQEYSWLRNNMRKIDQSRLPWIYLILCIIIVHRPLPPPTFLQTKVFLVVLLRFVETGLCELLWVAY